MKYYHAICIKHILSPKRPVINSPHEVILVTRLYIPLGPLMGVAPACILLTLDAERGFVLLDPALGPVPGAAVVHPGVLPGDAGDHELAGDQAQPGLHPDLHGELVLLGGDVLAVLLPPDAHLAHILALHGAVEADLVPEEDDLEGILGLGHLPCDPRAGPCVPRTCNESGQ